MNDFSSHARRQWYVAALSQDLDHGVRPVLLLGEALAMGRLSSGEVFALQDRCPHRGVPLSDGKVFSSGISCRYHGWTFNPSGHCIGIPGAAGAEQYRDIRVPAYAVRERHGLVWVARDLTVPFPARLNALRSGRSRLLWQARWQTPIIEAQAVVLGILHSQAVTAALARPGSTGLGASPWLRVSGDGFSIEYPTALRAAVPHRLQGSRPSGGQICLSGLGVAQREFRYAWGRRAWITFCFSPRTLASTHLYAILHVEDRWVPSAFACAALAPLWETLDRQDKKNTAVRAAPQTLLAAPARAGLVLRTYLDEAWLGSERHLPPEGEMTRET